MPVFVTNESELSNAVQGGEIHIDGNITLTHPIQINTPTTIVGGSITCPSGPAFVITSSNVEITRVRITGGGPDHDSTQKLIHAVGTQSAPLTNIRVRDCQFSNSASDNVRLEWCNGVDVSGNDIRNFRYSGVMVISCDGVTVNGNTIVDAALSAPLVNCYGIAVTDLDNTLAARSKNVVITGNRVDRIDWEGIDTHGGVNIVIDGNTVTGCPRGIALVVGNETRVAAPENCSATDNLVDSWGSRLPVRTGIWLAGIPGVPADGTITGNTVLNYGRDAFFADFVDRGATLIKGNNVPFVDWTPLPLGEDFLANDAYPPEYMIDGNTVTFRGGVIPKSATQRTVIGRLGSFARPAVLTPVGVVKGSNGSAGNGTLAVWPDGRVVIMYHSGTDTYTYFLSGSYEAI